MNQLLRYYVDWVQAMPIVSAMIQFAILGTLGEVISKWFVNKSFKYPFSFWLTLWKMFVWSLLAIGIKYAFVGHAGLVEYLIEKGMLPELSRFGKAFATATSMNLQFGPFMILIHRVLDNLVETKKNWRNLDKGFYALLWFWIPAHTLTFMLSDHYRIGVAALLSIALGLILGFFNRR
ncbi:MAG TPA: hypothetical protein PL126_07025 [Candidatus Cloacimonadota bacterium]|nr:hypothetical protein [Candidatus Cloacimonadota bacterium]